MRRFVIYLFALSILSCNKEEITFNSSMSFVQGTIFYVDAITGDTNYLQEHIQSRIIHGDGQFISNSIKDSLTGFNVQFGPLVPNSEYKVESSYYDEARKKLYNGQALIFAEEGVNIFTMELKPSSSTITLSGNIFYHDIVTGERISNQLNIQTTLTQKEGLSFNDSSILTLVGPTFQFDSLLAGKSYELTCTYNDSEHNIFYGFDSTILIPSNEPVVDIPIELNVSSDLTTISGYIWYIDPITGEEKLADQTQSTIKFEDPLKQFASNVQSNSTGDYYSFGPLLPETYITTFEFNDGVFDYELTDSLILTGNQALLFEKIYLPWKRVTSLLVKVIDNQGNVIKNTDVYLYNNYDFLLRYKANEDLAIDHGITDEEGRVVFAGLRPGGIYTYCQRIYGNDTLTNINSSGDRINLINNGISTTTTEISY